MTRLDLSSSTKLATLDCNDNLLYSLSLAPGTPTESIRLDNNPAAFSLITPYLYNMLFEQYGDTESQLGLNYKLVAENQPESGLLDLRRELESQPYGSSTEVDIHFLNVIRERLKTQFLVKCKHGKFSRTMTLSYFFLRALGRGIAFQRCRSGGISEEST